MRALLAVFALVVAAGCSPAPRCTPGSCPLTQHCVYVGAATEPACVNACDGPDAGSCTAAGLACGCVASCQGCKDCVFVCQ